MVAAFAVQNAAVIVEGAAISRFVVVPIFFVANKAVFVFREALNLFLGEVTGEIGVVALVGVYAIGGNQELIAAQPSAGIYHEVLDHSPRMIEDNVVYLSEFLVATAVKRCAADVIYISLELEIAQCTQVRHEVTPLLTY